MNRYTYKAKRKDNGEWVYGYYVLGKTGSELEELTHIIIEDNFNISKTMVDNLKQTYEIIPETLCQCTGLKDIEGNYIFENDIIKMTNIGEDDYGKEFIGVINFREQCWCCNCKELRGYNLNLNKLETIGNKFDKE